MDILFYDSGADDANGPKGVAMDGIHFELESVSCSELPSDMLRRLYFVGHRNRVILHRDRALAVCIAEQRIFTHAKPAGAFARLEQGRGRKEGLVQILLLAQPV